VQDTEQLLTLLESEISAIQARYPHSPVMALSSLAEGADRLFARVIMEKDYRCMWCCLLPKKSTSVTSPPRWRNFANSTITRKNRRYLLHRHGDPRL
jgi:hypothetical protein